MKKRAKKFHEKVHKFVFEKDDLIVKCNESNKLIEKYKKLIENSIKNMK